MPINASLTHDGTSVLGGTLDMLADYAGVSAASVTLEAGWAAATTGFDVRHLAPARGERLVAIEEAVRVVATHAVSTVCVWACTADPFVLTAMAELLPHRPLASTSTV